MSPAADIQDVLTLEHDLAKLLLDWSWEGTVHYEELLEKVGAAYGHPETTAIVGSQSAMIQMGDRQIVVKCGIPEVAPLVAVPCVKALLADISAGRLDARTARAKVREIRRAPPLYPTGLRFLGVILLAVGFSVDVVGTWEGLWVAAVTAIPTTLCFLATGWIKGFDKIAGLVAAAISGVMAMLAWKWGWVSAAPGLLLIAANFIFIPGDAISLQALEMAEGRWAPAVDRLAYSIMVLVLEIAGVVLAAILTMTSAAALFPAAPESGFPWWAVYPVRILFTLGTLWVFQMRRQDFVPALVIVWIATAAAQLGAMTYGGLMGTFFGMLVAALAAIGYSRKRPTTSAYVLLITPVFALSPGSHGLKAMESWLAGTTITGVHNLASLAGNLLALAIGLLLGMTVMNVMGAARGEAGRQNGTRTTSLRRDQANHEDNQTTRRTDDHLVD